MDYDWFHCGTSCGPPTYPHVKCNCTAGKDGGDFGYSPEVFGTDGAAGAKEIIQSTFRDKYHFKFAGIRKPRSGYRRRGRTCTIGFVCCECTVVVAIRFETCANIYDWPSSSPPLCPPQLLTISTYVRKKGGCYLSGGGSGISQGNLNFTNKDLREW